MRLLTLAVLILAACADPAGGAAGRLTGRFESTPWAGDARLQVAPGVGPALYSEMRGAGGVRTIGVKIPHSDPGTYPIPEHGAWYTSGPRDVLADQYVAHASGGTIVITRIDDREIVGRLEITLIGPGGDTLRFTDGSFVARTGDSTPN